MSDAPPQVGKFGVWPNWPRLSALLVLFSCTLVTTLYATTLTIANVSLPQIQGAMSATPDQIAWVITANLIATAVTIPAAGWLSARFGRKRAILGGVAGFGVSSLMCGLSTSLEELIIWRVIQSACGSPLVPISQSMVLDQFQGPGRGPAIAFYGLGVTLGPTIAPLIGGYVSEEWSWHWVFFILLPLAVVAFAGMAVCVRDGDRGDRKAGLDWIGFLSLAVAVSCIQLVLDRGGRNEWLTSVEVVVELALAAAAIWVFLVHSLTARRPFLDLRLLTERNFCLGMGIGLIFGMLFITPTVLLPTALQLMQGVPDFSIGLMIAIRGAGTAISQVLMMVFSARFDPRLLMLIGFGAHTLAGWYMAKFNVNLTLFDVAWTSFLQGFGVGFLWTPITLVLFSNLPLNRTAEGAGMFHFLRSVGSSFFISASFVVVFHTANISYAELVAFISAVSESVRLPWVVGQWSIDSTAGLAQLSGELTRQSIMVGFVNAFQLFTWVSIAVYPLIFLVRWPARKP